MNTMKEIFEITSAIEILLNDIKTYKNESWSHYWSAT